MFELLYGVNILELDHSSSKPCKGCGVVGGVYLKYSILNTEAPLVISFSNAGEVTNPNHIHETSYSPWGYEYLCKKNLNVISFSCIGETTWYRNDLFIDFLESFALQLKKFRRKIGYGGSMGGYAVSAFANLLELDSVLLMNPISSLNTSSLVPWETRFASAANGLNWEQLVTHQS